MDRSLWPLSSCHSQACAEEKGSEQAALCAPPPGLPSARPHPCLASPRPCPPDCSSPRACVQLLPRRPPSPHPASAGVAPQPGLPSPPGSPKPILSPAAFFSLHLLFQPTNQGVPKFPYLFIIHLPGRQGAGSALCSLWRLSAQGSPRSLGYSALGVSRCIRVQVSLGRPTRSRCLLRPLGPWGASASSPGSRPVVTATIRQAAEAQRQEVTCLESHSEQGQGRAGTGRQPLGLRSGARTLTCGEPRLGRALWWAAGGTGHPSSWRGSSQAGLGSHQPSTSSGVCCPVTWMRPFPRPPAGGLGQRSA